MKSRSRVVLFALWPLLTACGEGAMLVKETQDGGVVVYPYRAEQGRLLSSFRKEAIHLMEQKCPSGYTTVREGETKGRLRQASPIAGSSDVVEERRWGIQFQCK
ncbi:MAG: hypothetical protein NBKEAIPA_00918 [Nitrospirae bacterium]|nr:MAG: hypothetical protein UZ03_NOB001001039 [Nitrospira sp. OLB3]MBV6469035.1 hypothetical protein [Nitrospirota bacterium]MCE7966412.1 hypothetical protein [Nitrospira sp. NTP2]MCK6494496.1 hypothetical protein [Nitrospira sp.]MEB2338132.1 hypothetical protein [Nitrospirales bacterium]